VVVETWIPDLLVEKVDTILGHVFETVQNFFGIPGGVVVDEG